MIRRHRNESLALLTVRNVDVNQERNNALRLLGLESPVGEGRGAPSARAKAPHPIRSLRGPEHVRTLRFLTARYSGTSPRLAVSGGHLNVSFRHRPTGSSAFLEVTLPSPATVNRPSRPIVARATFSRGDTAERQAQKLADAIRARTMAYRVRVEGPTVSLTRLAIASRP